MDAISFFTFKCETGCRVHIPLPQKGRPVLSCSECAAPKKPEQWHYPRRFWVRPVSLLGVLLRLAWQLGTARSAALRETPPSRLRVAGHEVPVLGGQPACLQTARAGGHRLGARTSHRAS